MRYGECDISTSRLVIWGLFSYTIYLAHSVVPTLPYFNKLRHALLDATVALTDQPALAAWVNRFYFWVPSIVIGILLSRAH